MAARQTQINLCARQQIESLSANLGTKRFPVNHNACKMMPPVTKLQMEIGVLAHEGCLVQVVQGS